MKKFVFVLVAAFVATHVAASDEQTIALSESVLAGLPRVSATVQPHHGVEAGTYEGVTLTSLLTKSGVPSGEAIRGDKLTLVVMAKAADGYAAGEWKPGDSVPIRFAGDKLFLLRSNGRELQTTIVKRIG